VDLTDLETRLSWRVDPSLPFDQIRRRDAPQIPLRIGHWVRCTFEAFELSGTELVEGASNTVEVSLGNVAASFCYGISGSLHALRTWHVGDDSTAEAPHSLVFDDLRLGDRSCVHVCRAFADPRGLFAPMLH